MKHFFIILFLTIFLNPAYGEMLIPKTTLRKEVATNNLNPNTKIFGVHPFPYEPYPTLILDLSTTEFQPACINEKNGEVSCDIIYSYNGNLKKETLHTTNYKCASYAYCGDPSRGRRCTEVSRGKELFLNISKIKFSCIALVTNCTCKKYGDPNSLDRY